MTRRALSTALASLLLACGGGAGGVTAPDTIPADEPASGTREPLGDVGDDGSEVEDDAPDDVAPATPGDQTENAPAALDDAEFADRVRTLAAFSTNRIGPAGGGPIRPSEDVVLARQLVQQASAAQLEALLASDVPAVRAHAAREIIYNRQDAIPLLRTVASDRSRIRVGSMSDTPPIRDTRTTIGRFVTHELDSAGLSLPAD